MGSNHPLLAPFFKGSGGFVLYKGYPPQRGDDVTALLALAGALPENVHFAPVPPHWNTVNDLRRILPDLLRAFGPDVAADGTPARSGSRDAIGDASTERSAAESVLSHMIEQALVQMKSTTNVGETMSVLRTSHTELFEVMLHMIVTNSENMARTRNLAARAANRATAYQYEQRDLFRSLVHLPQDVPVLIVGRPELFFGYYAWSNDDEPTDLRRLLDSAGYPNRYHFADRYDEWIATSPESAPVLRDRRTPPIRDRKTFRVYTVKEEGRRKEDVGFVLAGRTPQGQTVMVATGSTSLGTYAAVQLLLQDRRGFAEAMTALECDASRAIDIGFRCRYDHLGDELGRVSRFPQMGRADHLAIELLNSAELAGFSWGRNAFAEVETMLRREQPSGALGTPDFMTWEWTRRGSSLTGVTISAKPYEVSPERRMYPSAATGTLLNRIKADVEADRKDWIKSLSAHGHDPDIEAIRSDRSFSTFRPVLLLGNTGTGKDWIAEFIATQWAGVTIETRLGKALESKAVLRDTDDLHPAAETHWLRADVSTFMRREVSEGQRLYSLAVVETPESLLGSQLFGVLKGSGTDVKAMLSAFVVAGTGVLFLDEFLELEKSLQARLLVALQTGKVLPVGSTMHRPFFCRVIAATNRAETLADLQQLTERHEIRADLVARFLRRYEIPSLDRRPLEIVPILMDTLARERSAPGTRLRLRISRPALEVLLTHSYPENVRQLITFALTLDDTLVESFAQPSTEPDATSAICLRHLSLFGVPPGNAGDDSSHYLEVGAELETDFYEFAFPMLDELPGRLLKSTEPSPTPLLSEPLEHLLTQLHVGRREWLAKLSDAAENLLRAPLRGETLDHANATIDPFASGMRNLARVLMETHSMLKRIDEQLDAETARAFLKSERWRRAGLEMPFRRLAATDIVALRAWADGYPGDAGERDGSGVFGRQGHRLRLHKGVLVSFLVGRPSFEVR